MEKGPALNEVEIESDKEDVVRKGSERSKS